MPDFRRALARVVWLALFALCAPVAQADLEDDLGRSEVRIWAAPFEIASGRTLDELALVERLQRLGYERVSEAPDDPGEFFWGFDAFRIHRRSYRHDGRVAPAERIDLALDRDTTRVMGRLDERDGESRIEPLRDAFLEPEVLAESLTGRRAPRLPVDLDRLPERVWRPLLAAEDARFFDHVGVDGRSIARAMLVNLRAGEVVQGGSTITQQLVKNRDLTPERSLGRKVSEAVRSLMLEASYDKEEILESYLDHVYLGHVDGVAIHGYGRAARTYFSKRARELTLLEAATLAAMVQGPNRLDPVSHPERVRKRRDWVLSRLAELEWVPVEEIERLRGRPVRTKLSSPPRRDARHFLSWIAASAERELGERLEDGRGIVVETTLDAWLQERVEAHVGAHLARYRRVGLSGAAVVLDQRDGGVLAYVGGDPRDEGDAFDRARAARRQIGSTVKPLLLLEAFEECGNRDQLHQATLVADEPLTVDLSPGSWTPRNNDGRFRGVVEVRRALRHSYNVPFARIGLHCGLDEAARLLRELGLDPPAPPPPAITLGAVEASPVELAQAYTVFGGLGRGVDARAYERIEKPSGGRLVRAPRDSWRVVHRSTAYVVDALLADVVARGTGRGAALDGLRVVGKTGTTPRDAWFAGRADGVVVVVWFGVDEGRRLGLTASSAAAPLWRRIAADAAPSKPRFELKRPSSVVDRTIEPGSGRRAKWIFGSGEERLFRWVAQPPKDRWIRDDDPVPVVR